MMRAVRGVFLVVSGVFLGLCLIGTCTRGPDVPASPPIARPDAPTHAVAGKETASGFPFRATLGVGSASAPAPTLAGTRADMMLCLEASEKVDTPEGGKAFVTLCKSMIREGRIFRVSNGTHVMVLRGETPFFVVKVLDGEFVGREGWASPEWVKIE